MSSEKDILNVIQYLKGFTGFQAHVIDYQDYRGCQRNLILRKPIYYKKNQVLTIEFDNYTLVIRDALNRSYGNPKPTVLRVTDLDRNTIDIEVVGLASTMEGFLRAFVPCDYSCASSAV